MLQYLAHSLLLLWPFVLVPGKKRKKNKKKTENNQPPQPVVDSNAEETQTASERLWPAVQRATKPGLTLQYKPCTPDLGHSPQGLLPRRGPAQTHVCCPSVCGKLSTNLPAVLHYLNVSKSSTFNVYKYILLQKTFKNCGLQTYNWYICMCLCIYMQGCVCVCMCVHG